MNSPKTLFCGTVWMGIEGIAQSELNEKLDNCHIVEVSQELFGEGKRKIFFTTSSPIDAILHLRTFEDISICYFRNYIIKSVKALHYLARKVSNIISSPEFFHALQIHSRLTNRDKTRNNPSFKIIATVKGNALTRKSFRRIDAISAVQGVIQNRFRRWRVSVEKPALEFWVDIADDKSSFFLRVSEQFFSQRMYKTEPYAGSLPPTIAHALVRLAEPSPDEIFADPMCGSGTILAERLLFELEGFVIGGDVNPEAVKKCRTILCQLRTTAKFDLFYWDATRLPMQDGTIDRIVCNLPFGKKFPCSQKMLDAILTEFSRVVAPKGICVLLTNSRRMFDVVLKRYGQWNIEKCFVINLLGLRPYVYKLQKL